MLERPRYEPTSCGCGRFLPAHFKLFDLAPQSPQLWPGNMRHLRKIFRFGWPYMRRYWARLLAGVLLGVCFGLLTGSFVWVTKTLVGRMAPEQGLSTQPGPGPA